MIDAVTIVLEYVCPILGIFMGNLMFAAPVRDCYNAVNTGQGLQSLNPLPWGFMLGNTFGWIYYGILRNNWFLYFANTPGFLIAIYLNLQASKMQYDTFRSGKLRKSIETAILLQQKEASSDIENDEDEEKEKETDVTTDAHEILRTTILSAIPPAVTKTPITKHEIVLFAIIFLWIIVISVIRVFFTFAEETNALIVGFIVNLNLVFFYGAPLSTIYTVLKERDCCSIHVPTMITNVCNSTFWCAYGVAIFDLFIFVPNGLGAILGFLQIALYIVFPNSKKQ